MKKTLAKKLKNLEILTVADYLGAQKSVLTNDLELSPEDINDISEAVNHFINTTHNKDKEEEVVDIEALTADLDISVEENKETSDDVDVDEGNAEEVVQEEVVEEDASNEEEVVEEVTDLEKEEVKEENQ